MKKTVLLLGLALSMSAMADYKIIMQSTNIKLPENKLSPSSCKNILESNSSASDGLYMINPTGQEEFEVYCDMTTDGGGWTRISQDVAKNNLGITLREQAGFAVWKNGLVFTGDNTAAGKSDVTINISITFGYQEFYLQDYYWADYNDPNNSGTFDVNNNHINKPYQEVQLDSNHAGDITIGTDDNNTATMSFFAEMGVTSLEGGVFKVPVDKKIYNNGILSESLVIRALDAGPEDEDVFPWYQGSIYVR